MYDSLKSIGSPEPMKRRKKILAALVLVVCVGVAWLAFKWMIRPTPEMRPNFTADLGDGVTLKMIWIPGGTFDMGAEPTTYDRAKRTVAGWFGRTVNLPYSANESPVHEVTLDGFWMGETEVTQEQYEAVMGNNPSRFKAAKNPVEMVNWTDCQEFVKKINEKHPGMKFRLPTEAEWEYACRAGSTGKWCFGDDETALADFAWFRANSYGKTHPVGQKKPNAWGLYDMHGNVFEWCADRYAKYPDGSLTDPTGPESGQFRLIRGACWVNHPHYCRSAVRYSSPPASRNYYIGFRLSRTP